MTDATQGPGTAGDNTAVVLGRLQNPPFGTETSERLLMQAAGTEIARLTAENVAWRDLSERNHAALLDHVESHATTVSELAAALARVEALEEALRPLAVMAERYDPADGEGDYECWSGLAVPKIKHLRAARVALKGGAA